MKRLLLLALLLSACAGHKYPMAISFAEEMPLWFSKDVLVGTYEAYQVLRDCGHPALAGRMEKLSKIEIRYALEETCGTAHFCGCAMVGGYGGMNTVWLRKDAFVWEEGRCRYANTMCHEMLHLAGFIHGGLMGEVEWECCYK